MRYWRVPVIRVKNTKMSVAEITKLLNRNSCCTKFSVFRSRDAVRCVVIAHVLIAGTLRCFTTVPVHIVVRASKPPIPRIALKRFMVNNVIKKKLYETMQTVYKRV